MINIIANGKPKQTEKTAISYQEALDLVYPSILEGRQPTLTWKTQDGRAGTLTPGQFVNVSEGMIFNAANTGNA